MCDFLTWPTIGPRNLSSDKDKQVPQKQGAYSPLPLAGVRDVTAALRFVSLSTMCNLPAPSLVASPRQTNSLKGRQAWRHRIFHQPVEHGTGHDEDASSPHASLAKEEVIQAGLEMVPATRAACASFRPPRVHQHALSAEVCDVMQTINGVRVTEEQLEKQRTRSAGEPSALCKASEARRSPSR